MLYLYILDKYKYYRYEKPRNIFDGNNFWHIVSMWYFFSEFIHHSFENFKFYSLVHVTIGVFNTRVGIFIWWRRERFFSKANKQFQLKNRSMLLTWHLTCQLPNVSIAQQFIRLNSFACLMYHLFTNLKICHNISQTTNESRVLVPFVRHS